MHRCELDAALGKGRGWQLWLLSSGHCRACLHSKLRRATMAYLQSCGGARAAWRLRRCGRRWRASCCPPCCTGSRTGTRHGPHADEAGEVIQAAPLGASWPLSGVSNCVYACWCMPEPASLGGAGLLLAGTWHTEQQLRDSPSMLGDLQQCTTVPLQNMLHRKELDKSSPWSWPRLRAQGGRKQRLEEQGRAALPAGALA